MLRDGFDLLLPKVGVISVVLCPLLLLTSVECSKTLGMEMSIAFIFSYLLLIIILIRWKHDLARPVNKEIWVCANNLKDSFQLRPYNKLLQKIIL